MNCESVPGTEPAAEADRDRFEIRTASPAQALRLDGRVALVTGGSRGIGRATSLMLAALGATVVVASRNLGNCLALVRDIEASGGRALAVQVNVSHAEQIERTLERIEDTYHRLDILVNNAGANPSFGPLASLSPGAFAKTFDVNVRATWLFCRGAANRWMMRSGGTIINIASAGGLVGEPMLGAYSAAKAAQINLSKTLARELGEYGVRVNAVAPGLIVTEFSRVLLETDKIRQRVIESTSLKRAGYAAEVAGVVAWLASDLASFVTGAIISVDGGV